jgi:Mn-dependent DtxR family transcriptional regulator
MKLTKSQARYVTAVYELSMGCEGVRVIDIAERLSLSKASVSFSMTKLEQKGLVHKDVERRVYLTRDGELQAVRMMDKYELLKRFLIEILGVDKEVAGNDASAIEHVISVDSLCAICRFTRLGTQKVYSGNCPMPFEAGAACQDATN